MIISFCTRLTSNVNTESPLVVGTLLLRSTWSSNSALLRHLRVLSGIIASATQWLLVSYLRLITNKWPCHISYPYWFWFLQEEHHKPDFSWTLIAFSIAKMFYFKLKLKSKHRIISVSYLVTYITYVEKCVNTWLQLAAITRFKWQIKSFLVPGQTAQPEHTNVTQPSKTTYLNTVGNLRPWKAGTHWTRIIRKSCQHESRTGFHYSNPVITFDFLWPIDKALTIWQKKSNLSTGDYWQML